MTRLKAALDLIAEIPDVPDIAGMTERLRAVAGRFGIESLSLAGLAESAAPADAHALLIGWRRDDLSRRLGSAAVAPAEDRVPTSIFDASIARLQPRRRGGVESRPAATRRPSRDGADRWAIVSFTEDGSELDSRELAVLRLLATAVEHRLRELAGAPARTGERPLLSRRERECLQWTAEGKTTWEIASILDISQNTIDGYIASATKKLGAVNRTQAAVIALRRGLID